MYKIINWYVRRYKFPRRGWKFMRRLMKLMGVLDRVYTKNLHNGLLMYVNPSEHIQQQLFWYGYYEKDVIRLWESFIHNQFTILDIGANAGYYSLIASKRVKKVYAFEPSPVMRKQLEQNVTLNMLDRIEKVSVEPYAASNKTGTATLYLSADDNTGMTGMQPAANFSGAMATIDTIRIDEWLLKKGSPKIDMIKIDVEGSEMKVLEGMRELLERDHPGIFIEVIPSLLAKYGSSADNIYRYLGELDYQPYEIVDDTIRKVKPGQPSSSEMVFFMLKGYLPAGVPSEFDES